MSKSTNTLFMAASVLALTAILTGCDDDKPSKTQIEAFASKESCESVYGVGNCELPADSPVLMTEQNRPAYRNEDESKAKAECEAVFGAGNCVPQAAQVAPAPEQSASSSGYAGGARAGYSGGSGGVVHSYYPIFIPGQTYYYPNTAYAGAVSSSSPRGFYQGSTTARPAATATPTFRPTASAAATRSAAVSVGRGGMGATGATASAGA